MVNQSVQDVQMYIVKLQQLVVPLEQHKKIIILVKDVLILIMPVQELLKYFLLMLVDVCFVQISFQNGFFLLFSRGWRE